MKWLRRLYDWTISWADSPYGTRALFLLAFAESSFFPIPPDVLLIALTLGRTSKAFYFASLTTLGSVLGGGMGYLIGYAFFEAIGRSILEFYDAMSYYEKLTALYQTNAFWVIFLAAFTPIPYKAITITAGVCRVAFPPFVGVSLIGRGLRFFLVAGLIWIFGGRIQAWIDRYFNWLTWAFTILLVGGFLVLKYWLS